MNKCFITFIFLFTYNLLGGIMFGTNVIGSGLTLTKVLGGISKGLSIANQVIPLYQQAKPMIQNARKVMIKDENENDCDVNESKVTVEKITETEYQYYVLLVCNDYKTTTDETDPVIKFTPNKKSSQESISVTMKVTDNKKVWGGRYVITKN